MNIVVTSIVDLARSANNRLHHLLRALAAKHDVTLISPVDIWREKQVNSETYIAGNEDVLPRLHVIPLRASRFPPFVQEGMVPFTLPRETRSRINAADVLFDYNTLKTGYGAWHLASERTPWIYDLADDLPAMARSAPQIPRPFRRVAERFARRGVRRAVNNADCVTVTTPLLVEEDTLEPRRVEVLPNGVDTQKFQPEGTRYELPNIPEHAIRLGYVGVLREWVDFAPLLQGIKNLDRQQVGGREIHLVVAGQEGHGALALRKIARELELETQIHLIGTVPYPQVPALMRSFDAGLIPFDASGISRGALPLKLFEYMACGLPVITTSLPAVEATAGKRVIYANDADAYSQAIVNILDGHVPSASSGRSWVESTYSWDGLGNRFEALVREIANAGSHS